MTFKIEFSPRYFVLGLYKDRGNPTVRIYPLFFIRVSIGRPV